MLSGARVKRMVIEEGMIASSWRILRGCHLYQHCTLKLQFGPLYTYVCFGGVGDEGRDMFFPTCMWKGGEYMYKPVLAWEQEARFNLTKNTIKYRNQEGQQRNFAKHVQGPSPPTSPPTQATAFANIAQHWLDKYRKSNNKNTKKHPRSFPQLPSNSSRPAPKGFQKATKKLPKATKKR